jgi:4-aminobutyrate aminotransferase/(S)-3-amino-2-methylpropionate transaminase
LAVLDKIEAERLLERSRAVGETIGARLTSMQERFGAIGDVRGRGAMRAIELVADRGTKDPLDAEAMGAIGRGALERGVIVLTAGTYGNVVRLLPPITIEEALLDEGLDLLEEAVADTVG